MTVSSMLLLLQVSGSQYDSQQCVIVVAVLGKPV